MIEFWLDSGTAGILLIPFIVLYLFATAIVWLTHFSPARPFFASCIGIAGPFFASVAVLFGLFAAFLANDVQQRNDELRAAIFREADGVRTLIRLGEALDMTGRPVTQAAIGYLQWALADESAVILARDHHPDDLEALRNLAHAVLATELSTAATPSVHAAMLDALVQVRHARLERVTLSDDMNDRLDWMAMFVLGLLTQVAVAVVQLEKWRPQALALFVFTTAFAATVALIGLAERSFPDETAAAPFVAALESATP